MKDHTHDIVQSIKADVHDTVDELHHRSASAAEKVKSAVAEASSKVIQTTHDLEADAAAARRDARHAKNPGDI